MNNIHRLAVAAVMLLLLAAGAPAQADLALDAKKAERELVGLEQQYQQIVLQLQAKQAALPAALSPGLKAVLGQAQQCRAAIAKAKVFARQVQSGKAPANASKLLQLHMQHVRQKQSDCNAELTNFSKVAQDYLSARH